MYRVRQVDGVYLVNEKEVEEVGQRVDDKLAQLPVHHGRDAGEQVANALRRVDVVRRHQVVPEALVVHEQLGTGRHPPGGHTDPISCFYYEVPNGFHDPLY